MNLILLVSLGLAVTLFFRAAVPRFSVTAPSGFVVGFCYFTIFPVLLLFVYGRLPGVRGTAITGVDWSRDGDVVSTLCVMGFLTLVSFMMLLRAFPTHSTGQLDKFLIGFRVRVPLIVLLAIYVVSSAALYFATGLGAEQSHWATSKSEYQTELGIFGSLLMLIPATLRYVVLLQMLPKLFSNWSPLLLILLSILLAVDLYTTGTRFFLFQVILVVIFDRLRQGNFWPLVIVAVGAIPLAATMEAFTVARTHFARWDDRSISSAVSALQNGIAEASERIQSDEFYEGAAMNITEAASLGIFKYVYHSFGHRRPFLYGATLVKPLVAWIPRAWWPEKPANFSWIIGQELVGEGVSVNSTSIGEFYGNFGVLGAILPAAVTLVYVWLFAMVCPRTSESFPYLVFIFGIAAARNGFMESALPLLMTAMVLNFIIVNSVPQKIRGADGNAVSSERRTRAVK